jgi:hypothetical protein
MLAITMTGRAVAFLDILGFRKLVESKSTEELGALFSNVIGRALPAMNRPFGEPHDEPTLFPQRPPNESWCISHSFSDSIILISHDESEASALALLIYALRVTQMLIASKLPVRGAIAFGDMYVDMAKALFLGKALTQAYALEQSQHWIGVAIDPSVSERFPNLLESDVPLAGLRKCLFPRYEVPMKTGPIRQLHTLNWRWNVVAEGGTKTLFGDDRDWSARTKIQAALTYALEMRNSGRAYPADDAKVPIEVRRFFIASGDPANRPMPVHGDEY